MAQWLTAFDALPEDGSSVPNTPIRQLPTKCKASSRKPTTSLPSMGTALNCMHVYMHTHTHTHTQRDTHTHTNTHTETHIQRNTHTHTHTHTHFIQTHFTFHLSD